MDIVVKGRRTDVAERFRAHALDKLGRLQRFDHKVIRVDVEVSHEPNPRQQDQCERVELTCHSRGPVIRAEAAAGDPYAALDLAYDKLQMRLRRLADRRRVHHGRKSPVSLAAATAGESALPAAAGPALAEGAAAAAGTALVEPPGPGTAHRSEDAVPGSAGGTARDLPVEMVGDGPLVVREKVHEAAPMTLEQALLEMELVGHDFFLFLDAQSGLPSVVYRRRGYDYGVIRLRTTE